MIQEAERYDGIRHEDFASLVFIIPSCPTDLLVILFTMFFFLPAIFFPPTTFHNWSCRSVYRRQDVCVAKVILWILSSCTYWWENRYPYPPLLHDGTTPHSWLMTPYPYLVDDTPTHTWLMTPPILGWWPPHSWLMTPLPILGWWPPP